MSGRGQKVGPAETFAHSVCRASDKRLTEYLAKQPKKETEEQIRKLTRHAGSIQICAQALERIQNVTSHRHPGVLERIQAGTRKMCHCICLVPRTVLLAVYAICCHIWSAPGVLWAHAPSRPRIPKWFVRLMLVLTSCAVLLFLAGLASGPALEAIPVLSSNSTGPDNTANTASIVPSVVPGAVVAVSEWLMQLLQSPWTNQFNPVVVYLAVHREPVFQWFLQQLGVQRRQARPPPPPPPSLPLALQIIAGVLIGGVVGFLLMSLTEA